MEKAATSIFKKSLKEIKNSSSENDVKNAIINFTNGFNKMGDYVESFERDDIYTALEILMKNSPININYKDWTRWFDEVRDF